MMVGLGGRRYESFRLASFARRCGGARTGTARCLRGEVHFDRMSCGLHATDASHYQMMPACVAVPRDEADCIAAVAAAGRSGVPITPRGGATSLSGQTFGPGLVLDVSKYMDQVLEVNVGQRWARVQPGVIRDLLNAQLAPHRLHFAPDPATGNRATVGGMIGNNASGTRSIVYGKTIDHVLSCRVVLADGTVMDLEPAGDDQWRRRSEGSTRAAEIYRGVSAIIAANRDEILARYPKVMRHVSGYNLDEFVDGAGYTGPIGGRNLDGPRTWNLSNLIVGSEGTLACVLEAKLRLTPLPAATALAIVQFDDELASLRHVPEILAHPVSTVELLDELVIRESLVNATTRRLATFFEGQPKAVLIVEVFGSDAADAQRRIQDVVADLKSKGIGYAWPVRTDKQGQADVWSVRKLGLGLISNVPGPVKGQAFVEDACVPVEVLAEYIERLQGICRELDVPTTMYAHASVGVIHFRPRLDLHLPEHRRKMVEIANRAFELVCQYGGVFAGEHGDGLVRGEFIPRYYGPQLYEAFRQIKGLFDPGNVMNPGKIVDTPSMTSHLRYGDAYRPEAVPTLFHYREQDGFQRAVEQCNGVGACRKLDAGTMCPSFMATRDEEASTRGRANALRLAMSGQLGDDALASDRMKQVLDLCLACKACKSECPNAVDMARLKSEVLQMHHDRHGVPLGYRLIGDMPQMARWLAGPLAHVVNFVARLPGYGWLLEKMAGIDRRRAMPPFATRTLAQLLRARRGRARFQGWGRIWRSILRIASPRRPVRRHVCQLHGAARGRVGRGIAGKLRIRSRARAGRLLPASAAVQGPGPPSQTRRHQDDAEAGRVRPPRAADLVPGTVLRFGTGRRSARFDRRRRAGPAGRRLRDHDRRVPGSRGFRRTDCSAGRNGEQVPAARPLPPESRVRHRRHPRALCPPAGRDVRRGRLRLLRHGRFVRVRAL